MYQNSVLKPSGKPASASKALGLLGIVLDRRQVGVAAQDGRRLEAGGQDVLLGVEGIHQGLAVDRHGNRLAHFHIVKRLGALLEGNVANTQRQGVM